MVRMYITAPLGDEKNTDYLCSLVRKAGFIDYCFVRDEKIFIDPKELMGMAKEEIKKSDYFLVDMTEKPIGRSIESGVAYALGKKIVVIMKRGTQIKDTVKGIADLVIEYDNITEIVAPLSELG